MTNLVIIPRPLIERIRSLRSRYLPNETGGFLIGRRRGPHIEITGLTEQGWNDLATPISFERSDPSHRNRVLTAWQSSQRFDSLVGDWHSHPHGLPDSSSIDRSAWRTLARTSRKPVIGVIEAGRALPGVYFAAEGQRPFHVQLTLVEEAGNDLTFAAPTREP